MDALKPFESKCEFVVAVPTCVVNGPLEFVLLKILYPANPDPPESVDAVQTRFICADETAVAERFVGTVGGVVSMTLLTVTVLGEEVIVFPAASRARAVRV